MNLTNVRTLWGALSGVAALAAATFVHADPLSTVQMLREGGCGGVVPAARPLRHSAPLDHAAAQWAAGDSLANATAANGYGSGAASGVRVSGPDEAIVRSLRSSGCRAVADRSLQEIGFYQRGSETWMILVSSRAMPAAVPAPAAPATSGSAYGPPLSRMQGAALTSRALLLVNEARARGARCGAQAFAPAPPLALSGTLDVVAAGHALDMAQHNYFEHQDLSGHTPADRVRAAGYRERLVGENIAYGLDSVEEAVQGWLNSPDHCANIMDPRFVEMGIADAPGQVGRRGLYWVMELAQPKS